MQHSNTRPVTQGDVRKSALKHEWIAVMELGMVTLHPTRHALERASERSIKLPTMLKIIRGMVVEVEMAGEQIVKYVVKYPGKDTLLVLGPPWYEGAAWSLISCYPPNRNR